MSCPAFFLTMIISTLALMSQLIQADAKSRTDSEIKGCSFNGPVLLDRSGFPAKFQTSELLRRVVTCVAPKFPALARQMRMNGNVRVEVLVDETGHVACARAINGHPILIGSAIDAAHQWTFRPLKHGNVSVAFYGYLSFKYSTETTPQKENTCLVAHW